MTVRQMYEYALIELNKLKAPSMLIEDYIYLLNKAIFEMTSGAFPMSDRLSLMNAEDGRIYNVDATFLENGILNGTKIILL